MGMIYAAADLPTCKRRTMLEDANLTEPASDLVTKLSLHLFHLRRKRNWQRAHRNVVLPGNEKQPTFYKRP